MGVTEAAEDLFPCAKNILLAAAPLDPGFPDGRVQDMFALAANSYDVQRELRTIFREGRAPHQRDPLAVNLGVRAESDSNPLTPQERARYNTFLVWTRVQEIVTKPPRPQKRFKYGD
jgi:hypothetical protein